MKREDLRLRVLDFTRRYTPRELAKAGGVRFNWKSVEQWWLHLSKQGRNKS